MGGVLHRYGLVRFSKKTGKVDKAMTGLGKGLIQTWALQNTTKTKACLIMDLDERKAVSEYVGTEDGFPEVHKSQEDFEFDVPDNIYEYFVELFPQTSEPAGKKKV